MTVAISFDNVSKRFILHYERPRSFQELLINLFRPNNSCREEFWALEDVSFDVEQGEMLGIIGPNGAGKSTILKLIARILEPTSGSITTHGKIAGLLELGAGFHPDLTGRENVFLNGSILGLGWREMQSKFGDIVEFAELGHFIDTPLKHYSSGMQMRLGFAVATSVDPDILLTDEVLAVGDESFQHKCMDRIMELRRRGKTVVFVSHSLAAVKELCQRAVWLDQGRVRHQGLAREVVDLYLLNVAEREKQKLSARHAEEKRKPTARHEGQKDLSAEGEEGISRWGTGEVTLTSVRLLGRGGEEKYLFETGEPVTIEIDYQVHQPVERPVFGIGIFRSDGLCCYGTNTFIDQLATPSLDGQGSVRVIFDSLSLLKGSYSLDVAVHTENGHPYDYCRGYCTFNVRSHITDVGVLRLTHRWVLPS